MYTYEESSQAFMWCWVHIQCKNSARCVRICQMTFKFLIRLQDINLSRCGINSIYIRFSPQDADSHSFCILRRADSCGTALSAFSFYEHIFMVFWHYFGIIISAISGNIFKHFSLKIKMFLY